MQTKTYLKFFSKNWESKDKKEIIPTRYANKIKINPNNSIEKLNPNKLKPTKSKIELSKSTSSTKLYKKKLDKSFKWWM